MSSSNKNNFNKNYKKSKRQEHDLSYYTKGILAGDTFVLSEAITIIETQKSEKLVFDLLDFAVNNSSQLSKRIAITGAPGAGKSSFIEALGIRLVNNDKKVAVLAIDPSSTVSKGSILGDKTRMEKLSLEKNAFIRPSPTGELLGGISSHTKEIITLCELAGYDYVFVETVGVGQSEILVKNIVDMTLLLLIPGAGDDLQGIKRGIVETADMMIVNKADGNQKTLAEQAARFYKNASSLFHHNILKWNIPVLTCSSINLDGFGKIMESIESYFQLLKAENVLLSNRKNQDEKWFYDTMKNIIVKKILNNALNNKDIESEISRLKNGKTNPYKALHTVINKI
jgi:LAO/AO transport system kinase